ncbi:MAG: alginate O-acetyltransferase AlgF [Proteobacteria bacterium]|nr:alginate O-acetyltransferase AlgF [Pseudomonadota bacterium]
MRRTLYLLAGLFLVFISLSAAKAAEPQLYETGPSEESSYIRFVNATEKSISVVSSKGSAKVELTAKAQGRVSRFFPVKSGSRLSANIQSDGHKTSVEVTGRAWEYITVAVLPDGAAQIKTTLVRETPEDFNAMRASLALFNLDAQCGAALMQGGAKNSSILDDVKPFSVQRRLINPVKLNVTVTCKGQTASAGVDLAQLQAGERYSVFLLKVKNAPQAFFARDAN